MGSETAAFLAFSATAVTIIFLLVFLIIVVGMAKNRFLQSLRSGSQQIKRGGGLVLILVGAWLVILAIWAELFAQLFPD